MHTSCRRQVDERAVWAHALSIRFLAIAQHVLMPLLQLLLHDPAHRAINSGTMHVTEPMGRSGLYWLGFWSCVLYWVSLTFDKVKDDTGMN